MDNIIVKITAESDMSDATKDFDSLKQKEAEILQGMEALKKKQAEFQGAPKVISLLDAEYKKLEKDLKTTQTTMSGFAKSQKGINDTITQGATTAPRLVTQLRAMKQELARMEMEGISPSDKAFIKLAVSAGQLEDQIGDTRQRVAILSSDTKNLDAAMSVGTGLAGGFSAATSAAALLGGENEELTKAFLKVQAAMSILNGIQAVAATLNKDSAASVVIGTDIENSNTISKIKNYTATKIQAANTVLETAANNGSKVAKVGATVTQWALNAAVYAFPAVAIIAALAVLVGGIYAFASANNRAEKAQKDMNFVLESTGRIIEQRKRDAEFLANIAEAEGKSAKEITAINVEEAKKNVKIAEDSQKFIEKKAKETRTWWGKLWNSSLSDEAKKAIDDAKKVTQTAYADLNAIIGNAVVGETQARTDANKKKEEDQKTANEKAQEKAREHAKYLLEIDKQLEDSTISIMKDGFAKQEAQIILEFNRKIALIKGNSEKEIALRASLEVEKNKKIAAIAGSETLKGEKITGDGVIKMFEKTQDKKSDIQIKAEEKLSARVKNSIKNNDEANKAEADNYKRKEEEKQAITAASMQAVGEIGNILFEAGAQKREQEISDLDREYSTKIEAAEGNKNLQMKLEDELAAKKLEIRIKQAKADKAQAIFNIGLSTAQAIIGMLANPGGAAGIALSVIAGVTGAAQIAAALAKPLPKYAKGKKAGGGGHFATVGELGAETMWIPDNAAVIPHNRSMNFDTFKDFNIPFEMDSKLMRGNEIDYDKLGASVGKNIKIPTPKPVTVHVDKSGVAVDYSGSRTTYLNKKYVGSW